MHWHIRAVRTRRKPAGTRRLTASPSEDDRPVSPTQILYTRHDSLPSCKLTRENTHGRRRMSGVGRWRCYGVARGIEDRTAHPPVQSVSSPLSGLRPPAIHQRSKRSARTPTERPPACASGHTSRARMPHLWYHLWGAPSSRQYATSYRRPHLRRSTSGGSGRARLVRGKHLEAHRRRLGGRRGGAP